MIAKHQWSKFYWSDWLRDPGLRTIGFAAKGLWMDLLCHMHGSERPGYLMVGNKPASTLQIAKMVGADPRTITRLLAELEEVGVASRDENGALFCRRMVRDYQRLSENIRNGRMGGNPQLKKNSELAQKEVKAINQIPEVQITERESPQTPLPALRLVAADKPPPDGAIWQEAISAWNQIAGPQCGRATKCEGARRQKLKARIANDCKGSIQAWRDFCQRVVSSPHLRGENDRGWRADIDWVLEPGNFLKITEGRYDPRERVRPLVPERAVLSGGML